MDFYEELKERLFYYHNATDIPLELISSDGEVILSLSDEFRYCRMVREACGERAFCDRMYKEGIELAAELGEGYIFSCPAGLVRYVVPVLKNGRNICSIVAGPVAMDYPEISVVDGVIKGYSLSIDIRQKLYAALSAIPIVEPVRIQHLCKLLFALADDLVKISDNVILPGRKDDTDEISPDAIIPDDLTESVVAIPIVQKAAGYIDEHYQESIRLEDVAAYVGLNPSYFSSIFKRELKISFSNYLTQKRIEEACNLLQASNHSLSDIAAEAGFENQSYFSQSFRKHTGMSPKEYRRTRSV